MVTKSTFLQYYYDRIYIFKARCCMQLTCLRIFKMVHLMNMYEKLFQTWPEPSLKNTLLNKINVISPTFDPECGEPIFKQINEHERNNKFKVETYWIKWLFCLKPHPNHKIPQPCTRWVTTKVHNEYFLLKWCKNKNNNNKSKILYLYKFK